MFKCSRTVEDFNAVIKWKHLCFFSHSTTFMLNKMSGEDYDHIPKRFYLSFTFIVLKKLIILLNLLTGHIYFAYWNYFSEHLSWLGKGTVKTIHRSVLLHLIDSGDAVYRTRSFKVIYCILTNFPYEVRSCLILIAEAMGIRTNNPTPCMHKKFVTTLPLP